MALNQNKQIVRGASASLTFRLQIDGEDVHDWRDVTTLTFTIIDMNNAVVWTGAYMPRSRDVQIDTPKHADLTVNIPAYATDALVPGLFRMEAYAYWASKVPGGFSMYWPIDSVLYVTERHTP